MVLRYETLPERIETEDQLEDLLATPNQAVVDDLAKLDGDIMILGVAGKVGPGIARMARQAAPDKKIYGVARFSDATVKAQLEAAGVECLTCDLLDQAKLSQLPKVPNIIFMAGKKFGTTEDPPFAWAMNSYVPGLVANAFPASRIVAFSTLCTLPFAPVAEGGWDESVAPTPLGEYANSCAGRERVLQYFSAQHGTPGRLFRLNYAIDLRYGVLFDVASWVRSGTPIDIRTTHANVIWQGDVNALALRTLLHCTTPSTPLNIGGPEPTSIYWLAHEFAKRFDREPVFSGEPQPECWVNSTAECQRLFGYPVITLPVMIDWVADWISRGMRQLDKPTGYQVRDGRF